MNERFRAAFRVGSGTLAIAAACWALAIWLAGGFRIGAVTASDPLRPLFFSLFAALAYLLASGRAGVLRDARLYGVRLITPLALILAISPAAAGLARNSWTAGGADSYAYVSQADLWLHSSVRIPVPIASLVPWPDATLTFSPHGYRPAPEEAALVPVTAPGLPFMMAAAKWVAGHCAMFSVVPLSGALLVWMTFAIGRRLGSPAIGLAAAWLLATSPAFLAMLVSPMSDVPAAAFWATAIFFALSERAALGAGLAASLAILIRPNLAPLAAVIAGWKFLGAMGERRRPVSAFLMAAGILPGCVLVAVVNTWLYGSPIASGYGGLNTLFSVTNVGTNLYRYGAWLIESQTPLAVVGTAALFLPMQSLWPTRAWQHAAWLMAAIVAVVWALYIIYTPFDAWWYLRFLLPCWPAMCLGSAAVLVRMMERPPAIAGVAAFAILIAAGIHGIYFAAQRGAFPSGEGDHRYVSIAKLAEELTEPGSVIITGQHTGPTRYYGGRLTLRFDLLDQAWLDRAVQWLTEQKRHPYILLEEWELPAFRQRFADGNSLGSLELVPIMAYRALGVPGSVYLFDPARPEGPTLRPMPPSSAHATCVEPAPVLVLR